jgi:FRG domain
MSTSLEQLTAKEKRRFAKSPIRCRHFDVRIRNLSDYVSIMSTSGRLWYRGHADLMWRLRPSALRYETEDRRNTALTLIAEFQRVGEIKLPRPPSFDEALKWVQLAQHYGLPTRLLDWTESPTVALFYACQNERCDGVVFMMNPVDLNRASFPTRPRILDAHADAKIIARYLSLTGNTDATPKRKSVAINPVWNSERIMAQKGMFTLHGTSFDLDNQQAPSLVAVPILKEAKPMLQQDLERIGVDEMSLFPELEHACSFLKRRAGLC